MGGAEAVLPTWAEQLVFVGAARVVLATKCYKHASALLLYIILHRALLFLVAEVHERRRRFGFVCSFHALICCRHVDTLPAPAVCAAPRARHQTAAAATVHPLLFR